MEICRFSVPDFIAGTSDGYITEIVAQSFHSSWNEGSGREVIVGGIIPGPTNLVAHPLRSEFVVTGIHGQIQKWDITKQEKVLDHKLGDNLTASCVGYFRDGSMMAVGFTNGQVFLLDGSTLQTKIQFHNTRAIIDRVSCSATGFGLWSISTQNHKVQASY